MIAKILLGVLIGGIFGAMLGYFGKCYSGRCPLTANPYRGAIYGAVIGTLFALSFLPKITQTKESQNVVKITNKADFKTHVLDAAGICLVDFYSNSCGPCRVLAPTISSLADKYIGKVTVCKVDISQASMVAQNYGVRAIPTVLIINNGKERNRLVGLRGEGEYVAILDDLVGKNKN